MKVIEEKIKIKNKPDKNVKLYYTHHGPVTYLDKKNNKAYAIRCAWLETGGSPYLASLRMNQAKNWKDFKDACNYSNIPGENMFTVKIIQEMKKMNPPDFRRFSLIPSKKRYKGMDLISSSFLPSNIFSPL